MFLLGEGLLVRDLPFASDRKRCSVQPEQKENVQFLITTMSKAKLQAGWHLRVQITIFEPASSSFCTVPTLSVYTQASPLP